jgi:hypothetical protein
VRQPGFEPGTSCLSSMRSNQLSYWPGPSGITWTMRNVGGRAVHAVIRSNSDGHEVVLRSRRPNPSRLTLFT